MHCQTKTVKIMIYTPSDSQIKWGCQMNIIISISTMLEVVVEDNGQMWCKDKRMDYEDFVKYSLPEPYFASGTGYITDIYLFGDGSVKFERAYDDGLMDFQKLSVKDISELSRYLTNKEIEYFSKKYL